MRKIWKRVCTGILALATVITALPITSVHAAETQYWTESAERVGYIEHKVISYLSGRTETKDEPKGAEEHGAT